MPISNEHIAQRRFLNGLYEDPYYPDTFVDRGRDTLLRLCKSIETERPADLDSFYPLVAVATGEFIKLQKVLWTAGLDLGEVAREEIAEDFAFVADAYGFKDVDMEELIAVSHW